ncbi:DUF6919 domain-containing protein [Microbispora bryophytorum]|uniref:DUF6919 domain-containing protein n=1 Tax=Microbispora bryophytorum TaxID=1460882 RepID=UPI00371E65D5
MTTPTHSHLWKNARTLTDLGELTAKWLEGTISYSPTYGDGPDSETAPLIPVLAAANRAGYLTDFSQPGVPLADGYGQRAAVAGFADEQLVERIKTAILGTDLVAVVTPPGWDSPTQIPVTIDDGEAFTWAGGALDGPDIVHLYGEDCPAALEALLGAWQIDVLDPVWGRQDLLWGRLARVWA